MKLSEMFPGQYLKKEDLPNPLRVTLANTYREEVTANGRKTMESVVSFSDAGIKPMILNVTNGHTIGDAYGDESDNWRGKVVELYHDPLVEYPTGKRVGGIRVRIPTAPVTAPTTYRMTLAEAVQLADEHGLTQDKLIELLKLNGVSGSGDPRFTDTVRQIVAGAPPAADGFGGGENLIPF